MVKIFFLIKFFAVQHIPLFIIINRFLVVLRMITIDRTI